MVDWYRGARRMMVLLFYATLFVLGLGLHFVGSIFVLAALGDEASGLARWYAKLGLVSIFKPVVTVNASNELTVKRRSYDENLDVEKIAFGGLLSSSVTRYLRDPQDRLHRFLGVRFGFVEERTGLVFDPRDADAGGELKRLKEDGSLVYEGGASNGRVTEYVRGLLELPTGARGVNLQDVFYYTGGSARSQMVDWLIELYSRSQEPREQPLSFWQKLTPVAALIMMLLIGAFIAGNTGGGGGGGGAGGVTMPVGLLLAVASTRIPSVVTRERVVAAGVTAVAVAVGFVMFALFNAGIAFWGIVSLGLGLAIMPAIALFLGRSLGGLGIMLGQLYLILACFAFEKPVIHLRDDDTYTLAEYSSLENASEPTWYRFAKAWVGVAYDNTEGAWPGRNSTLTPSDIEEMSVYDATTAGVPPGEGVATDLSSGGHDAVVPEDLDEGVVGVQTRHATSWFRDVGRGRLLLRALKRAKEDHFGGNQRGDDFILKATIGFALLGLVVDVLVFF